MVSEIAEKNKRLLTFLKEKDNNVLRQKFLMQSTKTKNQKLETKPKHYSEYSLDDLTGELLPIALAYQSKRLDQ